MSISPARGIPIPQELVNGRHKARTRSLHEQTVKVSVVIPALNEERNVPYVFAGLPSDLFEVILVDGNSSDNTVAAARAIFPAVRVVQQVGKGKGAALRSGYNAAQGDIIVTLDADGSMDGAEIERFVSALVEGADFAKGSRFLKGAGSADITWLRHLGNGVFTGLVNLLYGTQYTDITYGYNAFWSRLKPFMNVACDGFAYEILINCRTAKRGLNVSEVPSYERARIHGASKLNAIRDGLGVLKVIIRERFSREYGSMSNVMLEEYRIAEETN